MKKLLFLLFLSALFSVSAHAQYYSYSGQAVINSGGVLKAVPNAVVRVCVSPTTNTPCTPVATAYSTPTGSAPFSGFADLNGNYIFYVAPGTYDLQISGPTIVTYTIYAISIASGSGGGTPCSLTALAVQFNNSGAFGCLDISSYASHTLTLTANSDSSTPLAVTEHDSSQTAPVALFTGNIEVTGSYNLGIYPVLYFPNGDTTSLAVGRNTLINQTLAIAGNTAIGNGSLLNLTTGEDNIAVGFPALSSLTTGYQNIAIGNNAGGSLTSGNGNTVVGYSSLIGSSGQYDTVIGWESMQGFTGGNYDVAIGPQTLEANSPGSQNIAIGYKALNLNTASNNTAIGNEALQSNVSATGVTAVGNQALQSSTGINNTVLGSQAGKGVTTGTDNTLLGYSADTGTTTGNFNIVLGEVNSITSGSSNILIGNSLTGFTATSSNQLDIGDLILGNTSTGLVDLSGASLFKVPVVAGLTLAANGEIGQNSTNGAWEIYDGQQSDLAGLYNTTIVDGDCVDFAVISTGLFRLRDAGAGCSSGGGGSGSVTSFSAGNLSPLFTTSVATASTTPALSFSLSTASAHKVFMNNTGSTAAPGFQSIGTGDLPFTYSGNTTELVTSTGSLVTGDIATWDSNGNAIDGGTFSLTNLLGGTAGANSYNFTSATKTELRVGAGLTTTTNGDIGYETMNKMWHGYKNGVDAIFGQWPASASITNGHCVDFTVSSSVITLADAGGACGTAATFQTNTVNNSSQVLLNLESTTGGSGITVTNTSGGIDTFAIANPTGQGNLSVTVTETSPAAGDFLEYSSVSPSTIVNATPGIPINAQTGTSYTVLTSDRGKMINFSNAGAITVTLPQANSSGFAKNFTFAVCNYGAGTATITPTTSTITHGTTIGGSSISLSTGECAYIYSDNTNYFAVIIASL